MIIKFKVSKQTLTKLTHDTIIEGSRNYLKCQFTFEGDEWQDITKTASFVHGEDRAIRLLDDDGMCYFPESLIKRGTVDISVYGGNLIPTSVVRITINEGGIIVGNEHIPEDESLYGQMIVKFDETVQTVVNSGQVVTEAKNRVVTAESNVESRVLLAKQSEDNAAASATNAKLSADNAKRSEDRAKEYADNIRDLENLVTVVQITDTTSTAISIATKSNTVYQYGTLTSLTITDYETSVYATKIRFTSGSTPTMFTIPTILQQNKIGTINIAANRKYTVIICDGEIVVGEVG